MNIKFATSRHGHVGEIRFAKPPHNYACPALLRGIADAIDQFDGEKDIRCILLSSEGKAFCGGADLGGDDGLKSSGGMDAIGQLYQQALRIFNRKKPMIAAVQGAAIGAGLGLALSADFRIAAPAARFSANFVRLGFHQGFALTHTLPRLIGAQKASWMLLSAERVKAEAALDWGLVDRVAAQETLLADARAMAVEIAANAPLALIAVRKTLTDGLAEAAEEAMRHEHAQQSALKATQDYAEGVASVFDRRDAKFIGA